MDPNEEIQKLRAKLAKAEAARSKAEEAQRYEESARKRAEDAQQQAEDAQHREETARKLAEGAIEPTTLLECLSCYLQYISPPGVQERSLSTRGGTVEPGGRKRPTYIRPWAGFLDEQAQTAGLLRQIIPDNARRFDSQHFVQKLGEKLRHSKLGSEKDLTLYSDKAVETPVTSIFRIIQSNYAAEAESLGIELGAAFGFENHLNALPEDETSNDRQDRPPVDQACIVRSGSGDDQDFSRIILCGEHKAPHKLTCQQVRAGLKEMDIRDVINRAQLPPKADKDGMFVYQAEELVASVLTQTYDYMVRCGICYGYVTTGQVYIFVKYERERPDVLYYHLAEPAAETAVQSPDTAMYCTAVCQLLLFCLIAIQSDTMDRELRETLLSSLPEWRVDWEDILEKIASSSPMGPGSSSSFDEPVDYKGVDRSPRKVWQTRSRCSPATISIKKTPSRSPSPDLPNSSSAQGRKRAREITSPTSSRQPHLERRVRHSTTTKKQAFCTHRCLQSLVDEDFLDRSCPNICEHLSSVEAVQAPVKHAFSKAEFISALGKQWHDDPDEGCLPINRGASSIVFKIRLSSHGYTLIGKGTNDGLKRRLEKEYNVYEQLRGLQGSQIPVCLGFFELQQPYFHLVDRITSMVLLSWAGSNAKLTDGERLPLLQALKRNGVDQNDIHDPNFCQCPNSGRTMAIDFENVTLSRYLQNPRIDKLKRKRAHSIGSKKRRKSIASSNFAKQRSHPVQI